jgi:hypothetical protein
MAPLLQKVDAVTIPAPILMRACVSTAIASVTSCAGATTPSARRAWGRPWRHRDRAGDPAEYEPNGLVTSADDAAAAVQAVGGRVVTGPSTFPWAGVAVVADRLATSWYCSTCPRATTSPTRWET